ncbi:hypothetical protein GO685_04995 [Wolbachia endosymbiont of Madathamugadia hiepei]|uniref:hypothetical protein n=1 Tax=Wolbachia endosymbiont of Madathamugadia hiepei TaxID=1241303 RepID=UPI00158836E5|nr:hypothetical protein [Wolbachia endosymbiont of Madathamugadia hiepei]NUX01808.1 hypothetical protein [Wolbachia endosymbiont of Madathamugadia hiepei]
MVIGQIKDTVLPINKGVIPAPLSCHPSNPSPVVPVPPFLVFQVAPSLVIPVLDTGIQDTTLAINI